MKIDDVKAAFEGQHSIAHVQGALRFMESLPSGLKLGISIAGLPHYCPALLAMDGGLHPAPVGALTKADLERCVEVRGELDLWWDGKGPFPKPKGMRT